MNPLFSSLAPICLVTGLFATAACHPEEDRPEGWTEETHGKDGEPQYDVVFPQEEVGRFDVVIDPLDWQAMLDDMKELVGEFGAGGQQSQDVPQDVTQEDASSCKGKSESDACDAPTPGGIRPGTCLMSEVLFCVTDDAITACQNLEEGQSCTLSGSPGSPPGSCVKAGDNDYCAVQIPGKTSGEGGPEREEGERDPIWVPSQVRCNGKTWWHVGIRFKGNSTLRMTWQQGSYKLPFKLDFDEFEDEYPEIDDQRFYGFKQLSFANNARDDSLLREKVAGDLFREAGVPAPYRAFYRVFIDVGFGPTYFGLYTMAEVPDKPMLAKQFGDDRGNLYKPEGNAATWQQGLAIGEESFSKKTNEEEQDWSDVEHAIVALHASKDNAASWRTELERYFDADGFLLWLAVNTVIQDWDTYGNMDHNYYLYGNPLNGGQLQWIPWDHNESLNSGEGMRAPLPLDMSTVDERWPLIRFLLDDTVYEEIYWGYVEKFTETVFDVDSVRARLQAEHDLVAEYVVGENGEQSPYTVLSSPTAFEESLEQLLDHVDNRHEGVRQALGL